MTIDLNKLWGEAKASDAGSFKRHPLGRFPGVVTDIGEKQYEGKNIFELTVETSEGQMKVGVWDIDDDDYQKLGHDSFIAALAQKKRLVVDLGQPEPANRDQWLDALGNTVGAKCTLVVLPHKTKKGEVVGFINAPEDDAVASGGARQLGGRRPQTAPGKSAY